MLTTTKNVIFKNFNFMRIECPLEAVFIGKIKKQFKEKDGSTVFKNYARFLVGKEKNDVLVTLKDPAQELLEFETYTLNVELSTWKMNGVSGLSIKEV